jgi:hypothetical protein
MPGPCSNPIGGKTIYGGGGEARYVPKFLAARIADYNKTVAENKDSKLSFKKPGSQQK